ncbi:MAG: hypothetical protein ETSY2_45480 [Candidatus Entotheonella gemina]|uniref:Uncharacterized protein n=1 Tax=Candidatus Entotheonella gemina TaxID=1429439 RepID=W4LHZ9_9BACT|nr:MAG: hypothetical protein ETSY2_45480 [Candidatus Entotheonella gemina]
MTSFGSTLPPPHGLQGFLAPHGLQGFAAFFTLQGLHGLQGFLALQGLQGLHGFLALQGLQGLHGFFAAHGLHGLILALAITVLSDSLSVLAHAPSRNSAVLSMITKPLRTNHFP